MNREIKFRAWNESKKIMCYDDEDRSSDYFDGVKSSDVGLVNSILSHDSYHYMQFTGLKDKDGKEIYEGDIITVKPTGEFKLWGDRDTPSVVEWDGCCYSFHEYKTLFHFVDTRNYVVTVIGNTCENPELLN